MAYFPNSSEGECFDNQCAECIYGEKLCPIQLVQKVYNYEAVNNGVATEILAELVSNDGTCAMFKMFKDDFQIPDYVKKQPGLF